MIVASSLPLGVAVIEPEQSVVGGFGSHLVEKPHARLVLAHHDEVRGHLALEVAIAGIMLQENFELRIRAMPVHRLHQYHGIPVARRSAVGREFERPFECRFGFPQSAEAKKELSLHPVDDDVGRIDDKRLVQHGFGPGSFVAAASPQRIQQKFEFSERQSDVTSIGPASARRIGRANQLAVLDAQRTRASAELSLAQLRTAITTDQIAIFLALGGGWQEPASSTVAQIK